MKAQDFAKKAVEILAERGSENGYDNKEERSAAKIAQVFNIVSGRDLTESEAWLFMMCLKLVREGGKHQDDNCVDLANYAFLRAESFQGPQRGFEARDIKVVSVADTADVFMQWPGGNFNRSDVTRVDVMLRNGATVRDRDVRTIDWTHGTGEDSLCDVVGWRPAK